MYNKTCTKITGDYAPAKGLDASVKWCSCNNKGMGSGDEFSLGQMM